MPLQRPRRTAIATVLASLLLAVGLVMPAPADAGTAADEQRFVQLINQTRASAGLPPLTVHPELTAQARSWASSMAATDQLAHAPDISRGIGAPWTVLGENVGVHGIQDVGQLHAAFVASPGHYQNIIDPRYGFIGVGVVVTEEGKLWTTHRFMATAAPAPTTTSPPPTTPPPTTSPPTTARPATAPPPTTARPTPTTTPPAKPAKPSTSTTSRPAADPPSQPSSPPPDGPPDHSTDSTPTPTPADAPSPPGGIADASADEQAPAATARGGDIEPVAAGPGRPDLAAVEQMLIDLIEAGI